MIESPLIVFVMSIAGVVVTVGPWINQDVSFGPPVEADRVAVTLDSESVIDLAAVVCLIPSLLQPYHGQRISSLGGIRDCTPYLPDWEVSVVQSIGLNLLPRTTRLAIDDGSDVRIVCVSTGPKSSSCRAALRDVTVVLGEQSTLLDELGL